MTASAPAAASDAPRAAAWATVQAMFRHAPIDEPIKLAEGWDPELVDDPAHLVEHLRVSIRGLLVDGLLTGHAFIFCDVDPISQAEQRCIYRVRIRAGAMSDTAEDMESIAMTFGIIVRALCHYGRARSVAFLSPGTVAHPAERRMVNCCVASIVRHGHDMQTFVSDGVDRRKVANDDWHPVFQPAPQHMSVMDLYGAKHVLNGLPRLDHLVNATQRSGFAPWDVLTLRDEPARVRVVVMVETQKIIHLDEIPPRHRARSVIVDRINRAAIVEEPHPVWRLNYADACDDAKRIADAFDALGVLPTRLDGQPIS